MSGGPGGAHRPTPYPPLTISPANRVNTPSLISTRHNSQSRPSVSPAGDRGRRMQSRVPDRKGDARPQAGLVAAIVVLGYIRRGVELQVDRPEIVADQSADSPLALLPIDVDRVAHVPGCESHGAKLPLAEFLGRREVEVDEVRVAVEPDDGRRAWGELRVRIDAVDVCSVDQMGGEVPASARVADREALVEGGIAPRDDGVVVEVGADAVADAQSPAEIPSKLDQAARIVEAGAI